MKPTPIFRLAYRTHLLCGLACLIASMPTASQGQDLILRGGWLFDSVGDAVVKNTGIVVRGGVFLEVGADLTGKDLTDTEVVDLEDNDYILPGIFDLHAHYNIDVLNRGRIDETKAYPIVFLANGVTSTFPCGEFNPHEMMELRKRVNRGEQIGPRIFNSGPYFGNFRRGWNRQATTEDIYREVDYWAEQGVGGFKAKHITARHMKALIERAHLHGLTVTAHLDSGWKDSMNPKEAILMGIDRIEHFLGGDAVPPTRSIYASMAELDPDDPGIDEIIDLYIKHGVYFDATIMAYGFFGERKEGFDYWDYEPTYFTPYVREWLKNRPPRRVNQQYERIYQVKRKTAKKFFDAGGLITLGTDRPSTGEFLSGFFWHREIDAFVRLGIPPAKAIKIATTNGARALNVTEKLGTIEPGKFADLMITRGNPLENIRNTRNVHHVMKAGRLYESEALLKSVEGEIGPAGPEGG